MVLASKVPEVVRYVLALGNGTPELELVSPARSFRSVVSPELTGQPRQVPAMSPRRMPPSMLPRLTPKTLQYSRPHWLKAC